MSERMNLWPGRAGWPAAVNLSDYPSMKEAIKAFARRDLGCLKVFGPPEAIQRCKRTWARLEAKDPDMEPSGLVTWVTQTEEFLGK